MEVSLTKAEKKATKAKTKKVAKKKTKAVVSKMLGDTAPFRKRMQAESRYLATILDPFNVTGVKVPDEHCMPTAVAHCRAWAPFAANTGIDQVFGFAVAVGQLDTGATSLYSVSTTSTGGAITWNGVGPKSYQNTFANLVSQLRPVSSALKLQYLGTELNLSGKFIPFFIPSMAAITGTTILPTTVANAELLTYSDSIPIQSNRRSCTVRWLPQDTQSRAFGGLGATTVNINNNNKGYIGILMYGTNQSSTASPGEAIWCENFEFCPSNNLVNLISTSASPSDPIEMAVVNNAVAHAPDISVQQVADRQFDKNPGAHLPKPDDSPPLFERILGGVEKLASTGTKVATTVAPLLAML